MKKIFAYASLAAGSATIAFTANAAIQVSDYPALQVMLDEMGDVAADGASLAYFSSSARATGISFNFRSIVRSDVKNTFLATCCVSVEPPCTNRPARILATMARASPRGSTPKWE